MPSHLVDNYIISTNPKDHRHTNKYVKNDKFLYPIKSLNNKPKSNDPSHKQIIAKEALNYLSPNLNIILGQSSRVSWCLH